MLHDTCTKWPLYGGSVRICTIHQVVSYLRQTPAREGLWCWPGWPPAACSWLQPGPKSEPTVCWSGKTLLWQCSSPSVHWLFINTVTSKSKYWINSNNNSSLFNLKVSSHIACFVFSIRLCWLNKCNMFSETKTNLPKDTCNVVKEMQYSQLVGQYPHRSCSYFVSTAHHWRFTEESYVVQSPNHRSLYMKGNMQTFPNALPWMV